MFVDQRGRLPLRPLAMPLAAHVPDLPWPYYHARPLSRVEAVYIHHSATPTNRSLLSIAEFQIGATAQEDFPALAYHLAVDGEGLVNICHDLEVMTWGVKGLNLEGVHVMYIGQDHPNDLQLVGLRLALEWVWAQLGRPLDVLGHSDAYPTQCPGAFWPRWREKILPLEGVRP